MTAGVRRIGGCMTPSEPARPSAIDSGADSADPTHAPGSHLARDPGTEPGDFIEFVAAETAEARVDDGVPGRGWRGRLARLAAQLIKFGLVGGVGFVIDLGLYNLLVLTVLGPESVAAGPIIAKVLSTLVAITTNWVGNRLWTFRHHRRRDSAREAVEFFAVSLAGLVVGLVPLWISHYLLGFTALLADNIANVIGLGLGSIFRFTLYRFWVFAPSRRAAGDGIEPAPDAVGTASEPVSVSR